MYFNQLGCGFAACRWMMKGSKRGLFLLIENNMEDSCFTRFRRFIIRQAQSCQSSEGKRSSACQKEQMPIIEDDAYGDLWFEEKPPQPLKAMDHEGNILYLGAFSKRLAPVCESVGLPVRSRLLKGWRTLKCRQTTDQAACPSGRLPSGCHRDIMKSI